MRERLREFGGQLEVKPLSEMRVRNFLERAMGIEPTSEAWEASILPLYDARSLSSLLIIHH